MALTKQTKKKRDKDKATRKIKASSASTAASNRKLVVEAPQHFRILHLPAELRNRIYDYCLDDERYTFAPSIRMRPSKSHKERMWQFIGLTQVCKILRSEFRTLWIRHLCIRVDVRCDLKLFIRNFLHHGTASNPVPRLIQYLWRHGVDNRRPFNITDILRLRSYSSDSKIEFEPEAVANDRDMEEPCASCLLSYETKYNDRDGYFRHDLDESDEEHDCACAHDDMDEKAWYTAQYDDMSYTNIMGTLIGNGKEAWLQDIQNNKVTVLIIFARPCNHASIQFIYKDPTQTGPTPSALSLLKRWGILENHKLTATAQFAVSCDDEVLGEIDGFKVVKMVESTTIVARLSRE